MPAGLHVPESRVERLTRHLPLLYVLCALWVAVQLCVLTPPFFTPDETAHSLREMQIAHGELLPHAAGAWLDANAVTTMQAMDAIESAMVHQFPKASTRPNGRVTEGELARLRMRRWSGTQLTYATFQNTAVYAPLLYLPQASGWRLGEVWRLTIFHSLLIARLFATVTEILFGWLALKLGRQPRWLLFAYLLLPTVLALNSSGSQDALLFSVAGLAMAILSRALSDQRLLSFSELAIMTLLLTACAAARPPYLLLVLAVFLPGFSMRRNERRRNERRRALAPWVCMFVATVASLGWLRLVHPIGTYVSPGAEPAVQLAFALHHPALATWRVVAGTAREVPGLAVKGTEVLGVVDVFPPAWIYALLVAGLAGVLFSAPHPSLTNRRARLLLAVLLAGVIAAISFAEYLIWNVPRSSRVLGLQSRYFLPLLPFAFLLLPPARQAQPPGRRQSWREHLLLVSMSIFLVAVLATPWVAALRFYNLGLRQAWLLAGR